MKQRGERFTELTSYEMHAARIFDDAGVDALQISDSTANNAYGNPTSLPVTVDELIPLARAVLSHDRAAGVVHERRRSGTDSRVAPVRQGDDNRLEARRRPRRHCQGGESARKSRDSARADPVVVTGAGRQVRKETSE